MILASFWVAMKSTGDLIQYADAIIPEFQRLYVGEGIRLHPKAPPVPVVGVEPGRYLLLGSAPGYNNLIDDYVGALWLFYLEEIDENTTRLISRGRNNYGAKVGFAAKLWFGPTLMEPIAYVTGRKMLPGIKAQAETATAEKEKHQEDLKGQ